MLDLRVFSEMSSSLSCVEIWSSMSVLIQRLLHKHVKALPVHHLSLCFSVMHLHVKPYQTTPAGILGCDLVQLSHMKSRRRLRSIMTALLVYLTLTKPDNWLLTIAVAWVWNAPFYVIILASSQTACHQLHFFRCAGLCSPT
jgi:hypothetical protein